VPLPVAHGLIGASVVAALRDSAQMGRWKWLAFGAFLGIAPDFDFALNWLRVSWGGWHHGFTHSIPFALVVGLVTIIALRQWKVRSFLVFSAAYVSHTLLDYMLTESRGVALWWLFKNYRYKLRLPNPIDYTYSVDSFNHAAIDLLKISLIELLIFGPILLAVILVRQVVNKRSQSGTEERSIAIDERQ
jgi:membrane-bound metal-dependent hydrolase YbcI (DUF457 family)